MSTMNQLRHGFAKAWDTVTDDANRVQVSLEAPGLDAGDFDIQLRDDVLVVRGEKKLERKRSPN